MIYDVRNLSFAYKGQIHLLNDVSFSLQEGEVMTVLGRNGAGKSTLMACLLGLLSPQAGQVLLNGKSVSSLSSRQIAREVGFVPQSENNIFSFTVLDYVTMGCACDIGLFARPGKKEAAAAEAALDELGISHLAERSFDKLSGGEQQQCTIARAIVRHPKAVLLDEPTCHLDVPNRIKVLRMVKELSDHGYAVMFTTHDPDHALMLGGSTLLFEENGRVTCGSVAEVITEERLQCVYGSDLRLAQSEEFGRQICICPGL